jgi:hypothetical protein
MQYEASYQSFGESYSLNLFYPSAEESQFPQKRWCLRNYTASYLKTIMFTERLKYCIATVRLWKQIRMPQEIWNLFLA